MSTTITNTVRAIRSTLRDIRKYDELIAHLENHMTKYDSELKKLSKNKDIPMLERHAKHTTLINKSLSTSTRIRQEMKVRRHHIDQLRSKIVTYERYLGMFYQNEEALDELFGVLRKYTRIPTDRYYFLLLEVLENVENEADNMQMIESDNLSKWLEEQTSE